LRLVRVGGGGGMDSIMGGGGGCLNGTRLKLVIQGVRFTREGREGELRLFRVSGCNGVERMGSIMGGPRVCESINGYLG